jgi:hypothetical protein
MIMKRSKANNSRRSYYRHPLSAVGGSLILAGLALFVVLVLVDFASPEDNPYRSIVTFMVAPAVILVGLIVFLISIWWQARQAHKKGEEIQLSFSITPSDPKYRRSLWLFVILTVLLFTGVVYSGYRGYEVTDSVAFCGETCHEVMAPQYVTYHNSPHARVPCVECHIGPGASFWVKSKVDGLRQVVATIRNSYSQPIETPVQSLRPAQQTCEHCHWPQQFFGQKMITRTYYRTDEKNSPWTVKLLVKIGGSNPRTGQLEGIHWHMLGNKIEYIAADEKRQEIVWVRMTDDSGNVTTYTKPEFEMPDTTAEEVEIRRFDCMDCHNRPSHKFLPPATGLNLALSTRQISPDLPYIREVGLELLNAEYESRPEANEMIADGIVQDYSEEYPHVMEEQPDEVQRAKAALLKLYNENFFPQMKTDYRARENNLSHFVNDGCFRCHDGTMESEDGVAVSHDCRSCHLIIAQGPSEDPEELESSITGLDFNHPEDIDEVWREFKCTECHTPESGY